MVGDPGPAGLSQASFAGGPDLLAAAVVLVGGGEVADPGMQAHGVVFVADDGDDGTETDLEAGGAYVIEPGHDAWITGDNPFVASEFESRAAEEYARE
jgi:hypothetical protein